MIPNVVNLSDKKWNVRKNVACDGKFKLAYAGVPGVGKDELATVVEAIKLLPQDMQSKVEFHIYGPDEKTLLSYLKSQGVEEIPDFVVSHGRQKQDEIPARLNDCHYTVLIRKPTLRTNAGFSTKMVESFAAGVPVIANITGDIATYLKDGENGIIVANETVEACRDALIRAYKYLENNSVMRRASIKTAQDNFDYRIYKEDMEDFLRL
jgi:glycosyltransferase involved in cell wall biosynthesis